ncbi:MAG: hypothetical protein NTU64_16915, partial [Hyphomicrobiales bacterium]|nr:hypothetical protein [Hyphomicrobiales bacterium]
MSPTIRHRSVRSTSCCSRSNYGTRKSVAPILGADTTVGGVTYIATVIGSPGVIRHTSAFAKIRFGRADKKPDPALDAFVAAGQAAKLDIDLSADIERERWEKFIFLSAMAGSTATFRSSIGPIAA